jgi:NTE family protein
LGRLPFALALSGGTAKSVAHVGILKALHEAGIRIDHISGTSGGSIVAALYASGMPLSSMEELALNMSWRKLMSLRLSRLGFISSKKIEEFMQELIGDVNFEDLKTPCYVIATDLETGEKKVFNKGSVARAIRASCSIPQIYLPVEIDGRLYIDGGFSEYLSIETLKSLGNVFAVGAQLASPSSYRHPRHILHLIMQLTGIMARRNYLISERKADFIIHPDLGGYGAFDFDSAEQLIDIGYRATASSLPDLEKAWKRKSRWWNVLRAKFFPDRC